jgi:hypothetical protein
MWVKPKLDWQSGDGVMVKDLNRIEGNMKPIASTIDVVGGGIFIFSQVPNQATLILADQMVHIPFSPCRIKLLQVRLSVPYSDNNNSWEADFANFHKVSIGGHSVNLSGTLIQSWNEEEAPVLYQGNVSASEVRLLHTTSSYTTGGYVTGQGIYFSRVRLRFLPV